MSKKEQEEYIEKWRELARPLEELTGIQHWAFDPGVSFSYAGRKSVHIPRWLLELINTALQDREHNVFEANYGELNQRQFHLDIVVEKHKVGDVEQITLALTDGRRNPINVHLSLGVLGTVRMRVTSPLNPDGPDISFKLFDAGIR